MTNPWTRTIKKVEAMSPWERTLFKEIGLIIDKPEKTAAEKALEVDGEEEADAGKRYGCAKEPKFDTLKIDGCVELEVEIDNGNGSVSMLNVGGKPFTVTIKAKTLPTTEEDSTESVTESTTDDASSTD